MAALLMFSVSAPAQDWSVVHKYFPTEFSASLESLPIPEIPNNDWYNRAEIETHRQIDYFAEYPPTGSVPRRVWSRFEILMDQYLITERKEHYFIRHEDCMLGDSVPYNWSGCVSLDNVDSMTLKRDSVMDWIDIEYLFTDYPPLPYPYPFPRLRPLRWDIDTSSPQPGWYLQWNYDSRGRLLQRKQYRWWSRHFMDFKIETDAQGRDTLVQVWSEWHLQLPGKPDSIDEPRRQVALHRLRYDAFGRLEYHNVNSDFDSQIPIDKQAPNFNAYFTDQVYVYDAKGRNVARVQLRPYGKGIFALTALRYNAKDQLVRKTTYLVHDNRTVGEWFETVAWTYDSLGRIVRKTQYCNTPLVRKLRQQPDTQWFKWDITRW